MKKKLTALACALTLITTMLTGCGSTTNTETQPSTESEEQTQATEIGTTEIETAKTEETIASNTEVNIIALKGPTAMGMVSFMDKADNGEITDNTYNFEIAASIDEVTPKIVQGKTDIAAVPANVASVLYNNTNAEVEVLAINTLGVLYIVESGDTTITSVEDLRGKTIYASGKGATPEYALNYILSENGINPDNDITIEWKSEHTECLTALLAQDNAIAMLPQPFVTTAQTKSDNINVVLDLTEEWDKLQEGSDTPSALLTGVVVARTDFINENPEAVLSFLDHYKDSVEYVNSDTEGAADLIAKYDIVTAEIAKKALPSCNITFIEGDEMKEKLSGYLNVLFEQNEKSIGGTLPDEGFYYSR
jgi:NitT/TauT family transport system substrate-binding protein